MAQPAFMKGALTNAYQCATSGLLSLFMSIDDSIAAQGRFSQETMFKILCASAKLTEFKLKVRSVGNHYEIYVKITIVQRKKTSSTENIVYVTTDAQTDYNQYLKKFKSMSLDIKKVIDNVRKEYFGETDPTNNVTANDSLPGYSDEPSAPPADLPPPYEPPPYESDLL